MQQLKTEIIIPIPETHVLIGKVELEELKQKADPEWATGIDWLSEQTGIISPQLLKERILFPFKDELINFVDYPDSQGEKWRFNTFYMKSWLRENFRKIKG